MMGAQGFDLRRSPVVVRISSVLQTAAAVIVCSCLMTGVAQSQSLSDTTGFISQNAGERVFNNGNVYRDRYSAQFDGCRMNVVNMVGEFRTRFAFDVRDVTFKGMVSTSSLDLAEANYVEVTCITGNCIEYSSDEQQQESTHYSRYYVIPGTYSRVESALKHLQTLCGGIRSSPF